MDLITLNNTLMSEINTWSEKMDSPLFIIISQSNYSRHIIIVSYINIWNKKTLFESEVVAFMIWLFCLGSFKSWSSNALYLMNFLEQCMLRSNYFLTYCTVFVYLIKPILCSFLFQAAWPVILLTLLGKG